MVLLSRSIVSKDSKPGAERVSSTIRELLWRSTTAEEPQASRRRSGSRSGARQSSTALVKQTKESYLFSDVLRCSRTKKDDHCDDDNRRIQMSFVVAERHNQADLWFRCRPNAVFVFRCHQPAVFVHAVHAELSSSTTIPRTRYVERYDYVPKIKFRTSRDDSIMGPTNNEDDQWWA